MTGYNLDGRSYILCRGRIFLFPFATRLNLWSTQNHFQWVPRTYYVGTNYMWCRGWVHRAVYRCDHYAPSWQGAWAQGILHFGSKSCNLNTADNKAPFYTVICPFNLRHKSFSRGYRRQPLTANILSEQSETASRGWSFRLGIRRRLKSSRRTEPECFVLRFRRIWSRTLRE